MTRYKNTIAFITARQPMESRRIMSPYDPFYINYIDDLDQNPLKTLVLSSADWGTRYRIESVKIPEEAEFVQINGIGRMDDKGFMRLTATIETDTAVLTSESWLAPKIFCYVFPIPTVKEPCTLSFQVGINPYIEKIFSEEDFNEYWKNS